MPRKSIYKFASDLYQPRPVSLPWVGSELAHPNFFYYLLQQILSSPEIVPRVDEGTLSLAVVIRGNVPAWLATRTEVCEEWLMREVNHHLFFPPSGVRFPPPLIGIRLVIQPEDIASQTKQPFTFPLKPTSLINVTVTKIESQKLLMSQACLRTKDVEESTCYLDHPIYWLGCGDAPEEFVQHGVSGTYKVSRDQYPFVDKLHARLDWAANRHWIIKVGQGPYELYVARGEEWFRVSHRLPCPLESGNEILLGFLRQQNSRSQPVQGSWWLEYQRLEISRGTDV